LPNAVTKANTLASVRVVVLMSTFNGQRYLVAQLKSILDQLPPGGRILIRDDGSTDATVETIRALGDDRIDLTAGHNLGFGASFLTLLATAPLEVDMVMFADQDDVWLPCKLERAWLHLQPLAGRPGLYGSAQMLVDAELRPLHGTPPWPRGPSLTNALTENIITGCTAAINRPAVELLQRAGVPDGVHFHDWWLNLVVSAFGAVVYDNQPTLLYRQHSANVIGHRAGWFGRQWGMVRFLLRHDWVGILLSQIQAFLRQYGSQLPPSTLARIQRYFHQSDRAVVPRWRLVFSTQRWRQTLVDEMALRVLLFAYKLRLWPLPGGRWQPRDGQRVAQAIRR
jgi:glycosyltransferase involved in cell wall biosynthesis